jgi:hypothetical protein
MALPPLSASASPTCSTTCRRWSQRSTHRAPHGRLYLTGLGAETRPGRRYLDILHRAGEVTTPLSAVELREASGQPAEFSTTGCMAYATFGTRENVYDPRRAPTSRSPTGIPTRRPGRVGLAWAPHGGPNECFGAIESLSRRARMRWCRRPRRLNRRHTDRRRTAVVAIGTVGLSRRSRRFVGHCRQGITPVNSRRPTSRSRFATAHPARRVRESHPGAVRAANGTRAGPRSHRPVPGPPHARP